MALHEEDVNCYRCSPRTIHERGHRPPTRGKVTTAGVAHRLRTATAHPHLAAGLATAIFTAASIDQLYTVHLTDLAPDATEITLHDAGRLRQAARHTQFRSGLVRCCRLLPAYE
ncbi:hypothetical protein [Streptomyces boncukensis]|uniref:Uncharacterized protein n=1 Tax=Streptomyces boncukensis TaxID=2711219 RepID=A0A6G4X8Q7_9ACTN|nr:hypothetical protein [Streptomyces boncukensis]NGO73134.1 hypothetical protein [Streptomyces boncukensis]